MWAACGGGRLAAGFAFPRSSRVVRWLAIDGGILNSGFIDRVRIRVQGGDGGPGSISFNRTSTRSSACNKKPYGGKEARIRCLLSLLTGSGGDGGQVVVVSLFPHLLFMLVILLKGGASRRGVPGFGFEAYFSSEQGRIRGP